MESKMSRCSEGQTLANSCTMLMLSDSVDLEITCFVSVLFFLGRSHLYLALQCISTMIRKLINGRKFQLQMMLPTTMEKKKNREFIQSSFLQESQMLSLVLVFFCFTFILHHYHYIMIRHIVIFHRSQEAQHILFYFPTFNIF